MLFEDTSGNQQPDLNNHSLDTSADDAGPSSSIQHVVSKDESSMEVMEIGAEIKNNDDAGDSDDRGISSQINQLKSSWMTMSGFVMEKAATAKVKVVDTYHSEQVQALKQRTADAVVFVKDQAVLGAVTAKEKAVETYHSEQVQALKQRTAEVITYAADRTKENAAIAAEKAKPHLQALAQTTTSQWRRFTSTIASRMDSSAAHTSFSGDASEHNGAIGEAIPSSSNPHMEEVTRN